MQNTVNYRGDGRKGAPRGPCPSFATSFTCTDFPPFNSTRSNDSSFPIFLQSRVEEFVFTSSRIEERILPIYETGCKRNVSFSLIDWETNLIIWISIFRRINSQSHTHYWNDELERKERIGGVPKILLFFSHSILQRYSRLVFDFEKVFLRSKRWNEGQEDLFWEKKRERFDSVEREEETKFLGQDCRRIQGTRQGYPRTTRCNLMTLIAIVKTNDERGNPVKLGRGFQFPIWYATATVIYFPFEEKIRVYNNKIITKILRFSLLVLIDNKKIFLLSIDIFTTRTHACLVKRKYYNAMSFSSLFIEAWTWNNTKPIALLPDSINLSRWQA